MINNDHLRLTDFLNDETEFIPLLSSEDEEQMNAEAIPELLSILPLRNNVLFPGVVFPITVGRDKSIKLIKDAYKGSKLIGVVAQKDKEQEDPEFEDLFKVGTVALILKTLKMPDGSTTIIIQGKKRFQTGILLQSEPYFIAETKKYGSIEKVRKDKAFEALISSLKDLSTQIIKLSPNIPSEATFAIQNIESPQFLVNFISSNLNIDIIEKQKLLELYDLKDRANVVLASLTQELQLIELKNQIQNKVKIDIDKQQRDYFLSQQLKTIQEELGGSPNEQEINELKQKAEKKLWSKEVSETFEKELKKLQRINSASPDFSVQLNYLNILVELPWNEYTEDNFDLKHAQKVLDEDHFGLEKVKERIIEYLAVLKLKGDMKSPIICLVGPPGVGKTSLGKSIARAINRKYVRMSLGGLRDESEIRGHRKTYIGAMPGRIIQQLRKVKSANPVFVLDEIDKILGMNINGDPSAALLEVLDPEQNSAFYDNFIEETFDLSKVMFISTANTLSTIHPALRDRMEVIEINGYIMEEKIEIAKSHLIPKQLREHGVKASQLKFSDNILKMIIDDYTRESGVRQLEKNIAKIIRNRAKFIANNEPYKKSLALIDIEAILGIPIVNHDTQLKKSLIGVATGLAWTSVGGEILFVEASLSQGKGNLSLTGNLGDVMKESAVLAFEYLKSNAQKLNLSPETLEKTNIHIHIPEGATPKDGPSAGITLFTAITSAFTKRKVRANIAMTGEITLRGKVLPVGGIREKILAAKRSKITDIVLSSENEKHINEINKTYLEGLKFHYINEMIELIDIVFEK